MQATLSSRVSPCEHVEVGFPRATSQDTMQANCASEKIPSTPEKIPSAPEASKPEEASAADSLSPLPLAANKASSMTKSASRVSSPGSTSAGSSLQASPVSSTACPSEGSPGNVPAYIDSSFLQAAFPSRSKSMDSTCSDLTASPSTRAVEAPPGLPEMPPCPMGAPPGLEDGPPPGLGNLPTPGMHGGQGLRSALEATIGQTFTAAASPQHTKVWPGRSSTSTMLTSTNPLPPPLPSFDGGADLTAPLPDMKVGSVAVPTVGSIIHYIDACKPCAFLYTKGCQNGVDCKFCHLCEYGEKKRRQKVKKEHKRDQQQVVAGAYPMGTFMPAVPR
mmetsp:Transcript_113144/g.359578  ORF Transcript_113144/g.359578 Transcript_113144/m.359578 type:complete len:333 (+) Transcript_113144:115-1113(+)